ncbi:FAD-dependent oxidoreductase [Arsenophonus nasoniae]|uniref:FAD-dependent oxidoreductase n=1 Tax=Arsenophonus nasoniae TaxID=638 RepID=UPI00387A2BB9
MKKENQNFDAVIIGGGFYGCAIAIYLTKRLGLKKILLVERENKLLSRASYTNQARVHNGYHYPRSFTTAFRSRINFPRFIQDWPKAIKNDFTKVYAIAKNNSKVTARQFERFCHEIGAKIAPAPNHLKNLFDSRLIESVYIVQEYAFDAIQLELWAQEELSDNNIQVELATNVMAINQGESTRLSVSIKKIDTDELQQIDCQYVFNCTYSGLNQLDGDFCGTNTKLKHEITEMALIKVPQELENLGITVMDGPFFSMMPFPACQLYSLSHVRYTPHFSWFDEAGKDPYTVLDNYNKITRVERMVRDASRYLPAISNMKYQRSLFEVKTVLVKSEGDDGRPILFEEYFKLPGFYSVLGGKIDNIYDVYEKLEKDFVG